jgi:hypothetical protein
MATKVAPSKPLTDSGNRISWKIQRELARWELPRRHRHGGVSHPLEDHSQVDLGKSELAKTAGLFAAPVHVGGFVQRCLPTTVQSRSARFDRPDF